MSYYNIYIPTFKRAGKVSTHEIFEDAIIVCPESQLEDYKALYPNMQFLTCPDSIEGNIARKRNWIKRNCDKDYFIMVDDDLKGFQKLEGNKQIKMTNDEIRSMIDNGFTMMEDLGTILWGMNVNTDPKCYMAYTPINMLSPILGPFTAQKKDKHIWYDERLSLKEDYDLSLQVLRKYHKVLRLNKYSYVTEHLTNAEGGCVDYRTMTREAEQNKLFQKKWGSKIVKYDMEKSINPRVIVPLKGV